MHKSVKYSKSEENQMSRNKKDLPVLNPDSEDIGSSAEPSQAQVYERAKGAEPESQHKAAAGSNFHQTQILLKMQYGLTPVWNFSADRYFKQSLLYHLTYKI